MITQAEFGFVRASLSAEDPKHQDVSPIYFNRDDYGVIIGLNCIEAEIDNLFVDGIKSAGVKTYWGKNRQPVLFFNTDDNIAASQLVPARNNIPALGCAVVNNLGPAVPQFLQNLFNLFVQGVRRVRQFIPFPADERLDHAVESVRVESVHRDLQRLFSHCFGVWFQVIVSTIQVNIIHPIQ